MWDDSVTLGQVHDIAARQFGERECLMFADQRWSFSAVKAEIDRVAKGLIEAGVESGEPVCLWLGNCPEFVFAFYAVAKIGAVPVPINSRFRSSDMSYVLEQSDATTLIFAAVTERTDYLAMVREVLPESSDGSWFDLSRFPRLKRLITIGASPPAGCLDWTGLGERGEKIPDDVLQTRAGAVDPKQLAFIMYTSGTTGFPKGVMHDHHILRSVFEVGVRMTTTPSDTVVNYLPLFHIYSFYTALLLSPLTGARHVLMTHFDPGEALRLVESERATMIHGFELHFKELLAHADFARRDLTSLRTGILGAGMRSTVETARLFQTVMATVSGWGMTEIGVGFTMTYVDSPIEVRTTRSGWPQYGCEVRIVDPDSRAVLGRGELGEIECRGLFVTSGYYKNPRETAALIDHDGWLRSGDTGLLDDDGCLRFYGRFKDLIRVGGENVDPAEVELLLLEHPEVVEAAAVAAPDPRLGEVVAVFLRCTEKAPVAEEIIQFCRERIASFKVPRQVRFVDVFPITETGKIRKSDLRERVSNR